VCCDEQKYCIHVCGSHPGLFTIKSSRPLECGCSFKLSRECNSASRIRWHRQKDAITWSGQFEYLERAAARLKVVIPVTCAKRVTRECNSASRIRWHRQKDANLNNATRPSA
jgi:hypothetical protein